MFEFFLRLWCICFHFDSAMQPIHGIYMCRRCHRVFKVEWANSQKGASQ